MKLTFQPGQWFARLPVGRQLFGAFAAILLLATTLGATGLVGLSSVNGEAAYLSNKWLKGVGDLSDSRALMVESREFELKHSRTDDSSYHAEYEEKLQKTRAAVDGLIDGYRTRLLGEPETELLGSFSKSLVEYRKWQDRVTKLGQEKLQADAADIADGASSMAYEEVVGSINKLIQFNYEGGDAAAAHVKEVYDQARWAVVGLMGLALVLGFLLAALISRQLLRQLGGEPGTAVLVARAVAEGDLSTPISLKENDTQSLLASLKHMQQELARTVSEVRRGSDYVAHASSEIASGNQDLSGRTEQQASELEETAATMEQLGTTVRLNADNAAQASLLAQGASSVAVRGGDVVGRVVETMKGINESSRKISDIISVIDAIAFQTNILALNAAVEAARAGEQGRGFAVVAGEVRNLAQRSAQAAKEIKGLIGASVNRVEEGSRLVDQAGSTMQEVVSSIRRVSDIVRDISAASAEQSSGVAQVGAAITRMDQGTQQNAALVEESAAAADSLKQQAEQLVQAVSVFKIAQRAGA